MFEIAASPKKLSNLATLSSFRAYCGSPWYLWKRPLVNDNPAIEVRAAPFSAFSKYLGTSESLPALLSSSIS